MGLLIGGLMLYRSDIKDELLAKLNISTTSSGSKTPGLPSSEQPAEGQSREEAQTADKPGIPESTGKDESVLCQEQILCRNTGLFFGDNGRICCFAV